MPKLSEMIESKFLKKDDCEPPRLLTIVKVVQHNVAMQGANPEYKWCCEFQEEEKPMVLNTTNMRAIERITGSDDTDDWLGKQIVCYNDPNISFGGKITGGIRVRAPKGQATSKNQTPPMEEVSF